MASTQKKLRDLKRLLQRSKNNSNLSEDIILERINEVKKKKVENITKEKQKKNSIKYHFIRFMERKKILRSIINIQKSADDDEDTDFQNRIDKLMDDLTYITYFPIENKYISLFPSKEESKRSLEENNRIENHLQAAREARDNDMKVNGKDNVMDLITKEKQIRDNPKKLKTKNLPNDKHHKEATRTGEADLEEDEEEGEEDDHQSEVGEIVERVEVVRETPKLPIHSKQSVEEDDFFVEEINRDNATRDEIIPYNHKRKMERIDNKFRRQFKKLDDVKPIKKMKYEKVVSQNPIIQQKKRPPSYEEKKQIINNFQHEEGLNNRRATGIIKKIELTKSGNNRIKFDADIISSTPTLHESETIETQYLNYLRKFNKDVNHAHNTTKQIIFKKSLQLIDSHNIQYELNQLNAPYDLSPHSFMDNKLIFKSDLTSAPHYELALNQFADYTEDEIQERFQTFDLHQDNTFPFLKKEDIHQMMDEFQQNYPIESIESTVDEDQVNWSSNSNFLGVSIISEIFNQGRCGACWAFVSASATEAANRIAIGLTDEMKNMKDNISSDVEGIPTLSAQELVDCDSSFNRGCYGGNPTVALYYIMHNGLSRYKDYPYYEKVGRCQRISIAEKSIYDRYYVRQAFRLPPNDQDILKAVLHTQGPVAIGLCGTDISFMLYSSGIYNDYSCCTTPNHALLLVGYGTDPVLGLDYWLALNSWGVLWGEDGFIRILRSDMFPSGLCGLAASPVIALGGYKIHGWNANDDIPFKTNQAKGGNHSKEVGSRSWSEWYQQWYEKINTITYYVIQWIQNNWQWLLAMSTASIALVILMIVVYGCLYEHWLYLLYNLRVYEIDRSLYDPL